MFTESVEFLLYWNDCNVCLPTLVARKLMLIAWDGRHKWPSLLTITRNDDLHLKALMNSIFFEGLGSVSKTKLLSLSSSSERLSSTFSLSITISWYQLVSQPRGHEHTTPILGRKLDDVEHTHKLKNFCL